MDVIVYDIQYIDVVVNDIRYMNVIIYDIWYVEVIVYGIWYMNVIVVCFIIHEHTFINWVLLGAVWDVLMFCISYAYEKNNDGL